MTLQRTDVDGVPVFWVDGPQPFTAHLIFRAGVRDESFMTTGLTHLVEHLAMSSISDLRQNHNAGVEPTFTSFTASGKAESVGSFLAAVCSAVSAPDLGRLDVEKKVLTAEGSGTVPPATAEHLRHRFGLSSFGLADVSPPALDALGSADVLEHLRVYFTAGNAALALSGPPPEGLRLALPAGSAHPPAAPARLRKSLPKWFEQGGPRLGLSFEVPADTEARREAARATSRIACRRALRTLRQEHGWIYDIDCLHIFEDDGRGVLCFESDPTAQHAEDVRLGLMAILRDLHLNGPTAEELNLEVEELQEHLDDPASAIDVAVAAAQSHLLGRAAVGHQEKAALAKGVTAEACRAALDWLEETAIFGMPDGTRPGDDSLKSDQDRTVDWLGGKEFRRSVRGAFYGVPGGSKLFVGDKGVTLSTDYTASIRWEDLVGVAVAPDGLVTLIGADSQEIVIRDVWFGDGRRAIETILGKAGEGRRFTPAALP
ncbi:insulinase family protein [Arthrobacter sp. ZGTC131]|uniref:insulinase family protein n=1 Tax=Arthrobacter sp. ZGTC131 TaxID=2058898 RepID=UPI0011AFDB34|nr:insulinase family protein [Arthrobacter sp. ZGTC131]